jgi:predicted nuclease of predicted toxin-antitoxin system
LGADDELIAGYVCEHDRLILTQDDDFFTELNIEDTGGVLFQRSQTLSTREVGEVVHEMSQHLDQSNVTLEYLSRNWL